MPPRIFYGWVVVAVAFVTMGIAVNARTAFSLLFPPILAEFGWTRGVTAGAFAFGFILSSSLSPFLGAAMDRWGARWVLAGGVVAVAAGLGLATVVDAPWQLYLTLGVLVASGSTIAGYIGHALFLPNWFVRRRGVAAGLAFSGVGVGSIVMFPWLQWLIGSLGWRAACLALVALLLAVVVPLNLLLQRQRPEELGLAPDGDPAPARGRAAAADNVVDHAWAATEWTLARAAGTLRFWCVFVAFFASLVAWYAVQVHQTKYLIEIGFAPDTAAYALGFVSFLGIPGQIILGHVSDRIGREWVWTISGLGFAACYVLLLAMRAHPSPGLLWAMVTAQGLLGYGLTSVFAAIPAELFQGRHYGSIFGVLGMAASLGAGVGPWMAGALHDLTGRYVEAFLVAMACSLLSIVAMWLAAPRKVRLVAGRLPR